MDTPVLDLSGPRLRDALQALVAAAEPDGGVEAAVAAIAAKAALFAQAFADGAIDADDFDLLCGLIAPARRRYRLWRRDHGFAAMADAVAGLLDGAADTATADRRMAAFAARFPADGAHRWVRDLAAELLHYTDPARYPLMTRWVWDHGAQTGVLREIWVDDTGGPIDAGDGYATFATLSRELSGFLADNGVFRDLHWYVDLLCAHVYGAYVGAHGGLYLRIDFSAAEAPMLHTRRMLGLDGRSVRGERHAHP